ncbi:hypothetical protein JKP88DRAFT_287999 [Tribonema minus]|uniref:Sulfotransferase n=1 Tax=Tribonema minus TaxID=303371 RepID=A0A835Z755_9STRA|nr:hypothetical protein JKP88DRAFT_287999 [Tribonema minus]
MPPPRLIGASHPETAETAASPPPGFDYNSLPRVTHKRVIISSEGRSGSTLVGSLFDSTDWTYYYDTLVGLPFNSTDWTYYYEPLRFVWPPMEAARAKEMEAWDGDGTIAHCSAHNPVRCTAASLAALFEARRAHCFVHNPVRRTAASPAALFEVVGCQRTVVGCQRTVRPWELLAREIADAARDPIKERRQWIGTRDHTWATGSAAEFLRASGLFDDGNGGGGGGSGGREGDAAPPLFAPGDMPTPEQESPLQCRGEVEETLSQCHGKVGVAAKIIRMTGRLGELFAAADAVGVQLDLLVHLVRDPRAVLASRYGDPRAVLASRYGDPRAVLTSRYGIGWMHPTSRTYNATRAWASSICGDIMHDARSSAQRDEYLLLRYEDLAGDSAQRAEYLLLRYEDLAGDAEGRAGDAEDRARMVYARIGAPVPRDVLRAARVYDGCVAGPDDERRQCRRDKAAMSARPNHGNGYDTAPRNFTERIGKWRDVLSDDEVRATEDGCAEVFATMYADATLHFASRR